MQHFLPKRLAKSVNPLLISFSNRIRMLLLVTGLFAAFSFQSNAQEPEIIKDWSNLREAEFHFDVFYRIIKCSPDSEPEIHLLAFNEGGNVEEIGFSLYFSDDYEVEIFHDVEKFKIGFAKTLEPSCENDENAFLKIPLSSRLDINSLKIGIRYNR